jgi:hypothetical protein
VKQSALRLPHPLPSRRKRRPNSSSKVPPGLARFARRALNDADARRLRDVSERLTGVRYAVEKALA